jgi:5-methylcytosine-specific restriction endonuclease McrA
MQNAYSWKEGENFLDYNWNEVVSRLFCEKENLQAICQDCHKEKSQKERKERKEKNETDP